MNSNLCRALFFCVCIVSLLYACANGEGGNCGGFETCSTGLACRDNICVPCGDPGEPCCGYSASCNGDGICRRVGERRQCVTDCGGDGEPCCRDSASWSGLCLSGLMCDRSNWTCGTTTPGPCSGGLNTYRLWRLDAVGCALDSAGMPFSIEADTQAQAIECVRQATGHIYQILDEPPEFFEY
ncbi:MAG: hypothetical protein AAFN74_12990, partial [Myxococcota bacterium]